METISKITGIPLATAATVFPRHSPFAAVYAIRCAGNDKQYVGRSDNVRGRIKQHLSKLRSGKHHSHRLQGFYNEFGEDSLYFRLIDNNPETERAWINRLCFPDVPDPNQKPGQSDISILTELRRAVADDGRSQVDIAKAAKMHVVTLSRFMTGDRDLSTGAAEKLAKALHLKIKVLKD